MVNPDGDVLGWRCEWIGTPEPSTLHTGSAWMEAASFHAATTVVLAETPGGHRYGDYNYTSKEGARLVQRSSL